MTPKQIAGSNDPEAMLEYRVAVLEGRVGWLLANNPLPVGVDEEATALIDAYAQSRVKERYPNVNTENYWRMTRIERMKEDGSGNHE